MTDSPSIVHQESPHNAEPQLKALIEPSNFYTPLSLAFQRNHSDFISDDHLARWKLQVGIEQAARAGLRLEPSTDLKELEGEELSGVGKRKEAVGEREQVVWTGGLDELKQKGKERTLRACLQCAGLRRDELSSVRKTEGSFASFLLSFRPIPLFSSLFHSDPLRCELQVSNGRPQLSPTYSGKGQRFDLSSSPSVSRRLPPISTLPPFTSTSSQTSDRASKLLGTEAQLRMIRSCQPFSFLL
jgi:hypothetical protein